MLTREHASTVRRMLMRDVRAKTFNPLCIASRASRLNGVMAQFRLH